MPETSPSTRPDWRRSLARGEHLHQDESGVISLLAVFVILGCTWLLLWVLNSSKQLDSKVRMQNAVDAAGQSGVGILARGMNAVAFANQLESELIAAVAVMQGASGTPAAASPFIAMLLPVFQEILAGQSGQLPPDRPIPAFRTDVVRLIPSLANEVTRNIGRANGLWRGPNAANAPDGPQGPLVVQLWSTTGQPVGAGSEADPYTRTLPLIDPSPVGPDTKFMSDAVDRLRFARQERERMVRHYLLIWALDLAAGDQAIASQLVAQAESRLRVLLNDLYPDSNLPMVLRSQSPSPLELERDLMFVGVAYRLHSGPTAPLMFRNPNASLALAMAFSQSFLFLPHPRFTCCPWGETRVDPRSGQETFIPFTDGWPTEWDACSQNWQAKLVPATARSISSILRSSPPQGLMNRPNWGPLSPRQMDALTHH